MKEKITTEQAINGVTVRVSVTAQGIRLDGSPASVEFEADRVVLRSEWREVHLSPTRYDALIAEFVPEHARSTDTAWEPPDEAYATPEFTWSRPRYRQ